jgi:transposase
MLHIKFRRDRLLVHSANTPAALIGMESCPRSQWLARKLQASDHTVKIIPTQFVKPYVKSNKNAMVDAAAIVEAVTRPTMRFVQIRQPEQSARQALHRSRSLHEPAYVAHHQMLGFLLEFGITVRQRAGVFRLDVPRALGDEENELPLSMRALLSDLSNDFKLLESRIDELSKQIQRSVQYSDTAR